MLCRLLKYSDLSMFMQLRHNYSTHIIPSNLQWQMSQIDKFCKKYGMDTSNSLQLGIIPRTLRTKLLRHLIFDDKRKTIFCFLPKVRNSYTKNRNSI